MKKLTIIIIFLLSISISAQNTYNIQPGVKNNQIILELSNISTTETAQIISLPNPSKGGAKERIKFRGETEKSVDLKAGETREVVFRFDVDYNIGKTEADTVEFMITDNKSIYQTKQFILQYLGPTEYKLEQNYPNPFNPTTKIRYSIPTTPLSPPWQGGEAKQGWLTVLRVYDILGNEVKTLVNEEKEPGYYEVEFNATQYASGVYVYKLQSSHGYSEVKKMLLLK